MSFPHALSNPTPLRRGATAAFGLLLLSTSGCFYDLNRSDDVEPGEIRGQAIREDGTAAAFADIDLEGSPLHTTAQADGRFSIRNVPEGTHRLFLREDQNGDGWPDRAKVVGFRIVNVAKAAGLIGVGEAELSGVNFGQVTLDGVVRLRGNVVDADAAAVAGARVVVLHDEVGIAGAVDEVVASNGEIEARAGTDANGAFVVPGIAAGTFTTFAFGQQEGVLLLSEPRTIVRREGEERLEGANALVVRPSTAPPRSVGFTLLPPPPTDAEVTVTLEAAGGIDAAAIERTATRTAEGYTIADIPVGPWALTIRSGALRSELITRFVLPGDGVYSIGRIALGNQGCSNCDCDGDGLRGLPVLETNHLCAEDTIAEGEAIWDACEPQCAPRDDRFPRACHVEGRVFDCEDDRDGQADPAERSCYGVGKGTDCDGDELCAFEDADDRCPRGQTCDAQTVSTACVSVRVPPPPVDGGPDDAGVDAGVDAGIDAGDVDAGFDAGEVDAGEDDAGVPPDAGLDAGVPFDAGELDAGDVDAGFDAGEVDAGEVDAGEVDAGLVIPPIDAGPPIPEGFAVPTLADGWTATEAKEVYFGKTAVVFEFGFTPISDCPIRRPAFFSSPTFLIAVFDTNGDCLYQLVYDDIFDRPAVASAPGGGIYVTATVPFPPQTGEFLVGLNSAESPVTVFAGENTVTVARLSGTGHVVEANAFDVNNGRLGNVMLASHPLGSGVALAGTLQPNDVAEAELILPSFAVARAPESDGVVVLLSNDLSPTGVFELDADENGVKAELTGLLPLSPTTFGLVGVTIGELFASTPHTLPPSSAQTFLAEIIEAGAGDPPTIRWARRLAGTLPSGAFGPAYESGGFALAFAAASQPPRVVFGDIEQGVGRFEIGGPSEPDFSLGGLLASTRAFAYDVNTGSYLTIANNLQGVPTAFFIDPAFEFATEVQDDNNADLTDVVELEVSSRGDLVFVVDNGSTAAIWADPIGPAAAYEIDTGVVGTDVAVSESGDVVYVDSNGDLVLHGLGNAPGTKSLLLDQVDAATVAIAGGTLVFASENSLFSMPLAPVAPTFEVALPAGIAIPDLAVDAATNTAYVLVEDEGIRPYVLGSGSLQEALPLTTSAASVVVARPGPMALVAPGGVRTEFGLPGALQLSEIVDGELTVNASGGAVGVDSQSELFPLSVGRTDGAFTVVGGVLGESVTFARQGGGTLQVAADDFDEQLGLEIEGFIGRFHVAGDDLEAEFIDQTETVSIAAFQEPPGFVAVDGSAGVVLPLSGESRLANIVRAVRIDDTYLWRSPPTPAPSLGVPTVASVVNQRDDAGFDVSYVRDVVVTAERTYMLVDLSSRHYFPGESCEIDLSGGGFKAVQGLVAFDSTGTCVFGRGYFDVGYLEFAAHPDGGIVLTLSVDGSLQTFDTTVGNTTQVVAYPPGTLDVIRLDANGLEVSKVSTATSDGYSFGRPFVLDDGAFGAAISHAGDLTVTYADASTEVATDNGSETVFVMAAEPDGNRRESFAYASDVNVYATAVIGLSEDRVLVATRPDSGTVNGVSASGTAVHLSEFVFEPVTPQTLLERTSTIENADVYSLTRSPAGSQVAIVGEQSGGQASFEFPVGNFPEVIPFASTASFVALYNVGDRIADVIWEEGTSASIRSAVINRFGHATLAISGDEAGFTTNFLRSSSSHVGTFGTGEEGVDILRIELESSFGGYRPTSFQQAKTTDSATYRIDTAYLATRGYVEEVFFIAASDPGLLLDGAPLPTGTNAAAPVWVPLALEGIAGR